MTCADFELLLSDYVDGNVTGEQRLAFEAHAERDRAAVRLIHEMDLGVAEAKLMSSVWRERRR